MGRAYGTYYIFCLYFGGLKSAVNKCYEPTALIIISNNIRDKGLSLDQNSDMNFGFFVSDKKITTKMRSIDRYCNNGFQSVV